MAVSSTKQTSCVLTGADELPVHGERRALKLMPTRGHSELNKLQMSKKTADALIAERRHGSHYMRRQTIDEVEGRELGLLYECPEELLAMRRAGFTFPSAMSQLRQVSKQWPSVSSRMTFNTNLTHFLCTE